MNNVVSFPEAKDTKKYDERILVLMKEELFEIARILDEVINDRSRKEYDDENYKKAIDFARAAGINMKEGLIAGR